MAKLWAYCATCLRWYYCPTYEGPDAAPPDCPVCQNPPVAVRADEPEPLAT